VIFGVSLRVPASVRRLGRLLRRRQRAAIAGIACGIVGVFALSRLFSVSCPADAPCVTLRELERGAALPEALHLYDRDGVLFAEVAGPLRQALPRDQIPDLVADAFVAVEDRRFWEHGGVDGRGVLRAALENLREGGVAQGASTIPMQLVRTLWAESLRGAHPWRRKVIEARLAPQLIEDLGHERVLTLYLNSIYLGNGVYGVERAAHHYFGVGVGSLSVGQVATLVGMTRSPEWYEPLGHPERALDVRNMVLRSLMQSGVITADQAQEAASRGLELARRRPKRELGRSHLTAAITRELRRVAPELAGTPGLRIHTSISLPLQADGEAALESQLRAIEEGRYGRFAALDSSAVLEGGAVALNPRTGSILAWIGGRDFGRSEFDHVEQARRQVGSLIKPFMVAEALERGFGIVDMVSADTVPIETETGDWIPSDHVNVAALPLREALVRSSNRAAAHLGDALGVQTVVDVAERAGLSGPIPAVPASSLGAFEATLLEVTNAYATFANAGRRVDPHIIQRIDAPDGTVVWSRLGESEAVQVIGERSAFVVLDALQAVVDRGTGAGVRSAGYQGVAAGKTGTTNDGRDAWFVGLTPGIAAGVWIGFDQPREIVIGAGGGALAAPVWGGWMREAAPLGDLAGPGWNPPLGLQRVRYDPTTGEVLDPQCRAPFLDAYYEAWVFTESYEPRRCRGGIPGFLDRLWRGIVPRDHEPLRPLIGGPRESAN
jgi:membrane peptidoglycan carboxypeptidase